LKRENRNISGADALIKYYAVYNSICEKSNVDEYSKKNINRLFEIPSLIENEALHYNRQIVHMDINDTSSTDSA